MFRKTEYIFQDHDRDVYGKQATRLEFTAFSPQRPGLSRVTYYIEDKEGKLNLFKKVESPYSKEETEGRISLRIWSHSALKQNTTTPG